LIQIENKKEITGKKVMENLFGVAKEKLDSQYYCRTPGTH
jgi:hypothetical protein